MKKPFFFAVLWEAGWWLRRRGERSRVFGLAAARAKELGLPLCVVGAPDSGPTVGPGCGDITLDIAPSACPNFIWSDITKTIPLPAASCVVFVSCTLEYVDDFDAAMRELHRIAGAEIYNVRVEPWSFVWWGVGYERAKRVLPWKNGKIPPVTPAFHAFGFRRIE